MAWVDHVQKNDQKMTVVLTPQATAKAQGEPIFKALAATTLKAQVAIADGKLTVTLAVPATMKEVARATNCFHEGIAGGCESAAGKKACRLIR